MNSTFQFCNRNYEAIQTHLEPWVSKTTQQQILGCAQSGLYSFSVCILATKGDRRAAASSAVFSILACVIYIVALRLLKAVYDRFNWEVPKEPLHRVYLLSVGSSIHLSKKSGFECTTLTSLFATSIPYALNYGIEPLDRMPLVGLIIYNPAAGKDSSIRQLPVSRPLVDSALASLVVAFFAIIRPMAASQNRS